MIKFAHPEWEHSIDISDDFINTIIVENPSKFYTYIKQLCSQFDATDEVFLLCDSGEDISFNSSAELIYDLIGLQINNKKTLSYLHKKIAKGINESELLYEFNNSFAELRLLIDKYADSLYIPLSYTDSDCIDINNLIKMFDIKIEDDSTSLLEKLINYINVLIELKNIKILFLVLAKAFLTESDLIELQKHCNYKDVSLVLFENFYNNSYLENEKILIIDKDLCEILVNY